MLTRQKNMILLIICLLLPYASNSHAQAAQSTSVKSVSTSRQFAGAPFDPEQTFNIYNGILQVQEKGDYTIVTWMEFYSTDGQHIFMSVAKNNKWLFRGKEVLTLNDADDDTKQSVIIQNNFIFYGDKKSLQAATVNLDNGEITSQKTLHTWEKPIDSNQRIYYPIKTNDRSGVIFEAQKGKYKIFLEGELSKPLVLDDPKSVLKRQIGADIVLTSKRDRLIFIGGMVTTVFDIKKKDMLHNAKGYDLTYYKITSYDSGKFYSYSLGYLDSIETLDENFKVVSTIPVKKPAASIDSSAGVTVKNNVLRFWRFNAYQNTNSLEVTSCNLGK